MSQMGDNRRYRPYHRTNRRYEDDCQRQYRRQRYHYSSSAQRDYRNSNDSSYRRSYRNDYQYPARKLNTYSYFSTPPPPLMSAPIPPPLPPLPPPLQPPPPPPLPPPSLLIAVPHERDSWIRSVKKTKINESTEQKTQYLETMLRMPQQKSSLKSSKFDRMRFADDQLPNTISTMTSTENNDSFAQSSFHLIGDINNHDEICTLERILFNDEREQREETSEKHSLIESEAIYPQSCSGFLIDNCDEEEELPPFSPPSRLLPPLSDDLQQQDDEENNERRVLLVSELDAADAERKTELTRQKRLHQKLQKKKKEDKQPTPSIILNKEEESISDWILEYDVNQVSRLSDEVRRTSITMTSEDKAEKVNLILLKIKKQQDELKKLRQYVMSMLGEQEKAKSSKVNPTNSNLTQDLLLAFLNQPIQSGCWLCSGKTYAEVATQYDDDSEQ